MKIIKILLLLPVIAFAKIEIKDGMVQPFSVKNYSIVEFVKDYAFITGKPVLSEKLRDSSGGITFNLNTKISINNFEKFFYTILNSKGYTAINDGSFVRIAQSRDVRYIPSGLYNSNEVPDSDQYIMVVHTLRNPVASSIARNMRPFMSRYGRIIDFGDEHSIAINDVGSNIKRILKIMDKLDNKKSLARVMKSGSKGKKNKENHFKEEIDELKIQKMKLEKKLLEKQLEQGRRI